ncbi:ferredoxin-type protein NapF [Saccharobesus litoralis]|uniref:Ferredoxin-type protein NapF n=1 Tax=Saccharobesus litoralis TaxID=2172099 RepID=A0A2S0VRN2_9ALTE|nr:ferredoxin-type protein NapF [Saccharobesus litoralis]AWB66869.1 ferredoxin-type protein NapF [Saccharobesus litoralis]
MINRSRRGFLTGKRHWQPAMRLPWLKDEQTFFNLCDQCGDCIAACETQLLKRDKQGWPQADFSTAECTFCQKCVAVCSKAMFVDDKSQKPWSANIQINDKCFASHDIYCQSCRDACDSRAIHFRYIDSAIPKPEINLTDCSQCGACIESCPQQSIDFNLTQPSTTE